jgi:hypothetical protein
MDDDVTSEHVIDGVDVPSISDGIARVPDLSSALARTSVPARLGCRRVVLSVP